MKHKKTILILSLLIISITYIAHPYIYHEENEIDSIKDEIIRFHVKANSDMEEDQAFKLKVRDEILEETGILFEKSQSIDETRDIIEENMDNIKGITEEMIRKEGKNLSVDVSLKNRNFPTKKYGNITFPSGEYETLQVTLGEGKGENWWCVMFPPLCFVDIENGNVNKAEESLQEALPGKDVDVLLADKESPIVLKSKILEVLEKTKIYFAER